MSDETVEFYDSLAEDYESVYHDWSSSVARQAAILDRLMQELLGPGPHRLLDCTCGIGTQALGLAALGHTVSGTDVSPGAIERAREEADRRLAISFGRRGCPGRGGPRRWALRRYDQHR